MAWARIHERARRTQDTRSLKSEIEGVIRFEGWRWRRIVIAEVAPSTDLGLVSLLRRRPEDLGKPSTSAERCWSLQPGLAERR